MVSLTHDNAAVAAPPAQDANERFRWVEVFRGLAILEVVFHHASGRFLGMLDRDGLAWLTLAVLNRTLHYAVPAFLMMTALVLTTALLRQFRIRRYTTNRALRALLPYLLWSGVYLAYRYFAFGASPDWSHWADYLFWARRIFTFIFWRWRCNSMCCCRCCCP
jgi:peptidoglycan/LPS O-acetylase OafA/YrhL